MATSSSVFYRIIRAGIAVLCLLGLTSLRVQNLDTTTPSPPVLVVSNERQHFATLYDTIFALFRLKICYCSWPPKFMLKSLCAFSVPYLSHKAFLQILLGPLVKAQWARGVEIALRMKRCEGIR